MARPPRLRPDRRRGRSGARAPVGCPACRRWTDIILVGLDGPSRPEWCQGYGRLVPGRQRVYIGVELDRV